MPDAETQSALCLQTQASCFLAVKIPVGNIDKEPHFAIIDVEARFTADRAILFLMYHRDYMAGAGFDAYPLWVRAVWGRPSADVFSDWALWQYAANAHVDEVDTVVDLNVMAARP